MKLFSETPLNFWKKAKFEEGFESGGQPIFGQDTAGYAIIKKGIGASRLVFEKYKAIADGVSRPTIRRSGRVRLAAEDFLLLITDLKYVVTNVTAEGFEMMDREADSDIPFSCTRSRGSKTRTFSKKKPKTEIQMISRSGSGGLTVGADKSKPAD